MASPLQALPLPLSTDPPDGPAQFLAFATAIEKLVVMRFATAAARDAAIPVPVAGMVCFLTSTSALSFYNGSTWGAIGAGGGAANPATSQQINLAGLGITVAYTTIATLTIAAAAWPRLVMPSVWLDPEWTGATVGAAVAVDIVQTDASVASYKAQIAATVTLTSPPRLLAANTAGSVLLKAGPTAATILAGAFSVALIPA